MIKSAYCGCGESDDLIPSLRLPHFKKIKFSIHQKALMYSIFKKGMQRHFDRVNKEIISYYLDWKANGQFKSG